MVIRIYKSQMTPSNEAPGARITARMRSQPIVNAEIEKGNVVSAAFGEAQEYALLRQKMINQAKRNEAMFGVKEALLQAVDNFETDTNPYDIINNDNKSGRWFDTVERIKKEMRSKVTQSKAELAYFDEQFASNELSLRFQLKDKLDTIIEERAKLAIDARNNQYIARYSNPYVDFSIFNLESEDIKNMLNQSVETGYMNPVLVSAIGNDTLNDIMKNVVQGYAGTNPDYVFALSTFLDITDDYVGVTDETKIAERDRRLAAIDLPNSDWTKIVLSSVDRNEARAALATTMTAANKFEAYRAKQIAEIDNAVADQFKNLKILAFSADLSANKRQNIEKLKNKYSLIFTKAFEKEIDDVANNDGTIDGNEFQQILLDFLNLNNQLSIDEQEKLEKKIVQQGSIFSSTDDPRVVDLLSKKVIADDADIEYLEDNIHRLTRDTYIKFAADLEKIGTDQEAATQKAFNLVMDYVKSELNFVDKDEMTGEERVSMQSTNALKADLLRLVFDEGSKLTDYNSIVAKADELLLVEKQNVKRALLPLFGNLLEEVNANVNFAGSISSTSANPMADLEAKFLSLPPKTQRLVEGRYIYFQGRLNTFVVRGFFE